MEEGESGGVGWRSGLSRFNAACHGLAIVSIGWHTVVQPNMPHLTSLAMACGLLGCESRTRCHPMLMARRHAYATRAPVTSREARSGA